MRAYAKTNNVMPDYLAWHEAGGWRSVADLVTINRGLSTRGITGMKDFDINEYGSASEQDPGHSAWFLARFDRASIQDRDLQCDDRYHRLGHRYRWPRRHLAPTLSGATFPRTSYRNLCPLQKSETDITPHDQGGCACTQTSR